MDFDNLNDRQFQKILSQVSPSERELLSKARILHTARKSPGHFAEYATGGVECELEDHTVCVHNNNHWAWADHLKVLNDALVDASENQRFYIISMGPRLGKSYLSTGFNPAWFIGTHPDKNILLISHTASLAKQFGQQSRDLIQEYGPEVFGVEVDDSTSAKEEWGIKGHKGKVYSMGVSGSITGKGGHLVVIDDPIKNQAEAFSKTKRENLQNMYQNAIRTRLMPGGSIVLIMTRWSPYDLAGWLLEEDNDRGWTEIRMPMICDEPETDPLGRKKGQPLWPQQFDKAACRRIQKDVSPVVWNALYQQKPMSQENTMFPNRCWDRVQALPAGCKMVRRWDLSASSTKDSDYSAGVLMALDEEYRIYIVNVEHFRLKEHETEDAVRSVAYRDQQDFPKSHTVIEQAGGAGKIVADMFVRKTLAGFSASSKAVSGGDKTDRAKPLSAQAQAGNVYILQEYDEEKGMYVDPDWVKPFISEAFEFPGGRYDDMIDAACLAYLDLSMGDERHLQKNMTKMQAFSPAKLLSGGYRLQDDDAQLDQSVEREDARDPQKVVRVINASAYIRNRRI